MTHETNLQRFLRTWRDIPHARDLKPPKPRRERYEERNLAIIALYEHGKSIRDINAMLGDAISIQRVHQILKAHKVKMRPAHATKARA